MLCLFEAFFWPKPLSPLAMGQTPQTLLTQLLFSLLSVRSKLSDSRAFRKKRKQWKFR